MLASRPAARSVTESPPGAVAEEAGDWAGLPEAAAPGAAERVADGLHGELPDGEAAELPLPNEPLP